MNSVLCCLHSPVMEIPTLKPLSEDQARFYFQDLIKGIEYCKCLCRKDGSSYFGFFSEHLGLAFLLCTAQFLVAHAALLKLGLVVVLSERATQSPRGSLAANQGCCCTVIVPLLQCTIRR